MLPSRILRQLLSVSRYVRVNAKDGHSPQETDCNLSEIIITRNAPPKCLLLLPHGLVKDRRQSECSERDLASTEQYLLTY